jgi:hypothetical protein
MPMKGDVMPKTERKPKDLLADRELIGFARRHDTDGQVVQRASSAKVTEKARLREEPEQAAATRPPRRDGD